jgi:single-strand DNA-binding protein
MAGLPEITIVGTLTADPEMRFVTSGAGVANFTVASNNRVLNKATGEWEDRDATFLRCTVWREVAERVCESLSRGDRVIVTGSLKQNSYETADGEKRTSFDVDVREIGPSLKWASAKVTRVKRGSNAAAGKPADDPWATSPSATNSGNSGSNTGPAGFTDEPPF